MSSRDDGDAGRAQVSLPPANPGDTPARFERKDVWDTCWADDNNELLAVMEKTRMYIFNGAHSHHDLLTS